ncbi:glycoside hydrolase family 97 C-terminal domain-containing protein [Chitinophaga pinensis]|uniref:glycoside hydrolase family 97 C-terminal domain-containing protein n=1 Tax=Chitinophaga pinensis TaxID=79329 RepID=UPI0021BD9F07|nr:glycoside hydrolase family 97 C-terminal domain-containing protein [Chitinophaga pinensis]
MFVGSTCDENGRVSRIGFDYLDAGKKYIATIYSDAKDAHYAKNPKAYTIRKMVVTNKSVLSQQCAPGGGYAISVVEADDAAIKAMKK